MRGRLAFALLLGAAPAAGATAGPPALPAPARVLFVGNSLTYANDLPRRVEELAAAAGRAVETRAVAYADRSLEDHWTAGEAKRLLARGGWTFVVLQQGPSALPESRALLVDYARKFAGPVRAAGAVPALYMVWPARARAADFDRVSASYRAAAEAIGGALLPAGDAWRAVWRSDPQAELYGPDGFHPSPLGTYVAALVVCQRLLGISPVGLPAPRGARLPEDRLRRLQEAVAAELAPAAAPAPR
jgi:hypothetical protein